MMHDDGRRTTMTDDDGRRLTDDGRRTTNDDEGRRWTKNDGQRIYQYYTIVHIIINTVYIYIYSIII